MRDSLKRKLETELVESKYGEWSRDFLERCTHHLHLEYPEAKLHVITDKQRMPPLLLLQRVMRRVVCLLRSFQIKKQLEFWLLPSPYLREHPRNGAMVREQHINGGFTYTQNNQIFILRFEEFPKVMLHETIHHLPLDTGHSWAHEDTMKLYEHFGISLEGCPTNCRTSLAPNEAIVETWAEVYQLMFLQHEYGFSFEDMLDKEKVWAAQQAKWILQYRKRHFREWKESTHSWSYMLIRAAILWNLDVFLRKQIPYNTGELTQLIIDSVKRKPFQIALQQTKVRLDSMRMSVFGSI